MNLRLPQDNRKGAVLAGRIYSELKELNGIALRVNTGWDKAKTAGDDYYLDGVAFNIWVKQG